MVNYYYHDFGLCVQFILVPIISSSPVKSWFPLLFIDYCSVFINEETIQFGFGDHHWVASSACERILGTGTCALFACQFYGIRILC